MALIRWWPLSGDFKDYSGNKDDLKSNNVVFSDDGKLKMCSNFTQNSSQKAYTNNCPRLYSNFSWTCWFYQTASSSGKQYILSRGRDVHRLGVNIGMLNNNIFIEIGTDSNGQNAIGAINNNTLNKWTHISLVVTDSKVYVYKDGELRLNLNKVDINYQHDENAFCIGKMAFQYTNDSYYFPFNGKINDVRIYDHALSLKEVKEIYKTKILHYKFFAEFEEPTSNLARSYSEVIRNVQDIYNWDRNLHVGAIEVRNWTSGYNGGVSSPTIGHHAHWIQIDGTHIMKFPNLNNSNGLTFGSRWLGISGTLKGTDFKPNTKYTVSYDQKTENVGLGSTPGFYHYIVESDAMSFRGCLSTNNLHCKSANNWERMSYTFTTPSNYDPSRTPSIYVYGHYDSTQSTFYVKNIQVEEKEIASHPMIPESSREMLVGDSSGFRNHGIVKHSTSPNWVTETKIGNGSIFLNGTKRITCKDSVLPRQGNQEWTVSCWCKFNSNDPANTQTLANINRGVDIYRVGFKSLTYLNVGVNDWYRYSNAVLNSTEWFHYATSFNQETKEINIWINGKLENGVHMSNDDGSKVPNGIKETLVLFERVDAHISDFRIYATALKQEDIDELYSTRASIDEFGNFWGDEIVENNNRNNIIIPSDITFQSLTTSVTSTRPDVIGKIKINEVNGVSGSCRLLIPLDKIKPYQGQKITMSFNYILKRGSFDFSDWCDQPIITSKMNGVMRAESSYNNYTNIYRFMDFNIGANTEVEIFNVSLEQKTLADYSNSVNARGQLLTNEMIEVDISGLKTKNAYGANWVRVFYHNNKSGTVLFNNNKDEFLKCNTEDKISDLWALEMFRDSENKFELLLEYQSGGNSYNRWKQTSNFTREDIKGYEPININWSSSYWGGLAPSNQTYTFVDGSPSSDTWYYAIGSKSSFSGGIPCFSGSETGWVEIWVRCEDQNILKLFNNGTVKATQFIEN